jgi:hypothetical protein
MDNYAPSLVPRYANRPNCWMRSRIGVACDEIGNMCMVKSVALAVYSIISVAANPPTPEPTSNFWSVIEEWGKTWMWENLTIQGEVSWLAEAIADNSLIVVTDGSFMKEIYPHINLVAFVFECTKGQDRLWGSFVEHSLDAGSYRLKLIGLTAIHLILHWINVVSPNLWRSVLILSNCLGALNKVEDLLPYRIPTQCSHLDILKNIMVNCSNLSFSRHYSHVKAHQDNHQAYSGLPREAQLNCQMDYLAKKAIYEAQEPQGTPTRHFPLEPVCVFLGRNKLTSNKREKLQFWVQKQLARSWIHDASILFTDMFDKVDWEMFHIALCRVPRMFQIWACKQIMDIALANKNRPWECLLCPLCPSCAQVPETCAHILLCKHAGRVDVLMKSINLLACWLTEVDSDPNLRDCIVDFAKGCGEVTMSYICLGMDTRYRLMAQDQDAIGWRRFMEGMICQQIREIQAMYTVIEGSRITPEQWTMGVVVKLLEATHGQ